MDYQQRCVLAGDILRKAGELGADLVGFADVDALRGGPSERLFPQMKDHSRDRFAEEITTGLPHGSVFWEPEARSVIVFAVAHPAEKPELDWWYGEINPPGNVKLGAIAKALKEYILEKYPEVSVWPKRYHVERGGIYLKEAAYQAGLGCIGRNNLLITPAYGPRVRLRALTISELLPATGPSAFDPCRDCPAPCVGVCPHRAFSEVLYTAEETGVERLPARNGTYARAACSDEMEENENDAKPAPVPGKPEELLPLIRYCRACELSCVVGRKQS